MVSRTGVIQRAFEKQSIHSIGISVLTATAEGDNAFVREYADMLRSVH